VSRENRPSWQKLGQESDVQDIRIDGYRRAVPTQAITNDKVEVIVQLPIRTQDGHGNLLAYPEMAVQVAYQLLGAAKHFLPEDHEVWNESPIGHGWRHR